MDKQEQIREGLRRFAERFGPAPTLLGTVVSVDADLCTMNVDELDIPDIRLRPVVGGSEGITVYPKEGAWAVAVRLEQTDEFMLIACSEVAKYRLVVDDMVYEVGEDKFLLKKGNDSLKDVIQLIIEAVQPIVVIYGNNPVYAKLTQALDKLNNIFQ